MIENISTKCNLKFTYSVYYTHTHTHTQTHVHLTENHMEIKLTSVDFSR